MENGKLSKKNNCIQVMKWNPQRDVGHTKGLQLNSQINLQFLFYCDKNGLGSEFSILSCRPNEI